MRAGSRGINSPALSAYLACGLCLHLRLGNEPSGRATGVERRVPRDLGRTPGATSGQSVLFWSRAKLPGFESQLGHLFAE